VFMPCCSSKTERGSDTRTSKPKPLLQREGRTAPGSFEMRLSR